MSSNTEGVAVSIDKGTITTGLLGVEVDRKKLDIAGPGYLTQCRLVEIERRILAIEEMVWPLGRATAPPVDR